MSQPRNALFIGVGEYRDSSYYGQQPKSYGANAVGISTLVKENNPQGIDPNWVPINGAIYSCPMPLSSDDSQLTSDSIAQRIHELFARSANGEALLYFSGYTQSILNGKDLLLLTADDVRTAKEDNRRGIAISDLCREAWQSDANSVTIILDCNHSGFATTIEWPRNTTILASGNDAADITTLYESQRISSDRPSLYTQALIAALKGAAADIQGIITPISVHTAVSSLLNFGYDGQRPILKTWSDTNTIIRRVSASRVITSEELRRLAPHDEDYSVFLQHEDDVTNHYADEFGVVPFRGFPSKTAAFQVHPEHEGPRARIGVSRTGSETWNDLNEIQRDMELFKHLRDAHLLYSFYLDAEDSEEHPTDLYWACMAETDIKHPNRQGFIKLTDLGQLYWEVQRRR